MEYARIPSSPKKLVVGLKLALGLILSLPVMADTVTRGPYLQTGTPDSVIVRWRSDVSSNSRVVYGTSPSNLTQTAQISGSRTEHTVKLTGLQPNTRYYYQVQAGASQIGDSGNTFKTAPVQGAEQPIRIWAIGDSGTANSNARAVRDAYKNLAGSEQTDVWLMLGDNAYDSGTDSEFQAAVFNTYPELLKQVVLWPTLGNHDGYSANSGTQSGPYYDIFTLPTNGEAGGVPSGTEAYYSFDYGNIHFICLESYETSRSTSGAMYQWLESNLQANTQPWTIAFWHHPPYTKGSHDSDSETELVQMRQNFNPLLEDYGVDLILSGHSHSYERSYLIDGHYGQSSTFGSSHLVDGGDGAETGDGAYAKGIGPHDGSVYVVAGSSGKTSSMVGHHPVMIRSTPTLGSMVLDVNGDNLDARFVTNNGNILDRFTITKDPNHQPPPSTSEEFIASADVYVRSNDTHDDGNTVNADGSDGGLELRGLFQWTPSGLPAGAQVTSASVKFSVVNPSGGSYDLYLVNNVWTEADVTWADATSLGAKVGTLSPSTTGTHTITLNAAGVQAVQGWVDGGSNNGLVLVTTGSTDGVDITSREGGSAAVLEVNFESGTAPTVPAAPSALAAAASGQNSIDLGWTDNADDETQFVLERSLNGGPWTTAATLGADTTGYTDTGLGPDTTYNYRIKAANSAGDSAYSNVVSATTDPQPISVPNAPSLLDSQVLSENRIALTWADNADNETGFEVQRRVGSGAWATIATPGVDQTGYDDTGLTPETTYEYRAAAANSAGLSAWSNTISATTLAAPGTGEQVTLELRDGESGYTGTQDGWIARGRPDNRYNGGTVKADGKSSTGRRVAFIKWDLTATPSDVDVDEVGITLEVTSPTNGEYGLYAMNGDWSEGASLTWNTVGGVSQAGSTLLGILSPRAKGSYTAFLNEAGLAQVRAWVDGSVDNQGFAIYDHSTNDGLNFRSSNYGTVAQRPKLTLSYTPVAYPTVE